jgi:hypothetical protein
MQMSIEQAYIDDSLRQFSKLKDLADRAIAQVTDEKFFVPLDAQSNSIAVIMKHLAGTMKSRWTDLLTSDGEKGTRDRDSEFEIILVDSRPSVTAAWEGGWGFLFRAISDLKPSDLGRTITIRAEAHTVLQAINRQLTHYAEHVGQIVMLAKHFAGDSWNTLSIPRGQSRQYGSTGSGTSTNK